MWALSRHGFISLEPPNTTWLHLPISGVRTGLNIVGIDLGWDYAKKGSWDSYCHARGGGQRDISRTPVLPVSHGRILPMNYVTLSATSSLVPSSRSFYPPDALLGCKSRQNLLPVPENPLVRTPAAAMTHRGRLDLAYAAWSLDTKLMTIGGLTGHVSCHVLGPVRPRAPPPFM